MMQITNALFLLAILGSASGAVLNPVTQVAGLIDDLIAKVEKDGAVEDETYQKFMIWCTNGKSDAEFQVKSFIKEIEKQKACISEATATVSVSQTSITQLGDDIAHGEADLQAITGIHEKEKAEFLEHEKTLLEAIDALERAINILEKNMQGSALLQSKFVPRDASNLIHALDGILDGLAVSMSDRKRLTQLIQEHAEDADDDKEQKDDEDRSLAQLGSSGRTSRPSGVIMAEEDLVGAPAAAVYEHEKSKSIIDILEDMRDKAQEELADLRKGWATSCHNFEMTCLSLENEIKAYKKEFSELKITASASSESMSTCQGDLSVAFDTCTGTMSSLADLLQSCMVATQDHTTSLASRNEELKALAEAKAIISESTGDAEQAVYGAASAAASFLQLGSSSMRLASGADLRNFEVVNVVRQLAKKTKSSNLMQLASKIAAAIRLGTSSREDPFEKVKGLITEMIDKLEAKAKEEATHKEYCDREMGNTQDKKDELNAAIEKLTSEIDKARSKITILKQEIGELTTALAELAKLQQEMDEIRAEEKAAFDQHKSDVTAGIEGVRRALEVLRTHYGGAAAFLQVKQSSTVRTREAAKVSPLPGHRPICELIDESTFHMSESETGQGSRPDTSGAGASIISMLELIESDFTKSLAEAQTDEDAAKTEYDKTSMQNKLDKAQKEKDVKYKKQQIAKLKKELVQMKSELNSKNSELDAVLDYWKTITAECVVPPETYEERMRRRQAEIDGLKEALRILTEEAALVQVPKGALRGAQRHR